VLPVIENALNIFRNTFINELNGLI